MRLKDIEYLSFVEHLDTLRNRICVSSSLFFNSTYARMLRIELENLLDSGAPDGMDIKQPC